MFADEELLAEEALNTEELGDAWAVAVEAIAGLAAPALSDHLVELLEAALELEERGGAPQMIELSLLPEVWYDAVEGTLHGLLLLSALLGMEHVRRSVPGERALAFADDDPAGFLEAIEALRSRAVVPASVFRALDDAAKARAFSVARLAGADAIARLRELTLRNMAEGETVADFVERLGTDSLLQTAGFAASSPWYWEVVVRTNQTAAANVGRHLQFRALGDEVVALEFVAILDERTTAICREYDGVVRPADDPVWETITPPNHYNCRSTLRAILAGTSEAEALDLTLQDSDLPDPAEGFTRAATGPEDLAEMTESMRERAMRYGIT